MVSEDSTGSVINLISTFSDIVKILSGFSISTRTHKNICTFALIIVSLATSEQYRILFLFVHII